MALHFILDYRTEDAEEAKVFMPALVPLIKPKSE